MSLTKMLMSLLERRRIYVSRMPGFTPLLRNFLAANAVNVVLDVGAFHGGYCRLLRDKVNYRGRIISFEPCAKSFKVISSVMEHDDNWRGFRYGLSNEDAAATLNTFARGEFNSVLRLTERGTSAYDLDPTCTPETIQLKKLDNVWSELMDGIKDPSVFLKMDTQGHDLAVLTGASKNLSSICGIQSELPAVEIYEGMTPMPRALQNYGELGFVPFGFYPVNFVPSYGSAFEFDVLLRKKPPR